MTALLQLTFDGALLRGRNQVSMRDLGQAMVSLQAAVDRACLDVLDGQVRKHQRLRREYYDITDFIVGQPTEGSYVLGFLSKTAGVVVDRLRQAIDEPYRHAIGEADKELYTIERQIQGRLDALGRGESILSYDEFYGRPSKLAIRRYGDKSIAKEVNQMLTPVRREDGGLLKLTVKPSDYDGASTFSFDSHSATRFAEVIGTRQLGEPVIYEGTLRELDRGQLTRTKNFRGKFINRSNNKHIVMFIESLMDFEELTKYLGSGEIIRIAASPIIEYDSFDPAGGDIQFLKLL